MGKDLNSVTRHLSIDLNRKLLFGMRSDLIDSSSKKESQNVT